MLLRPTSLASSRSALRLPRAGDAAPARARGARALEGLEGAVEVVMEAVEGVGVVVGVVRGVAAAAAAVEAAEAVVVEEVAKEAEVAEEAEVVEEAEVEEAAEAATAVVERVATLRRGVAQRGGGFGPCTYVLRTGDRAGEQCRGPHSTHSCCGRLTDAWRRQFPEASEILRWGDLSRAGVAVFDLDYDAILAAMYSVTTSVEGDCYLCVPPDPGIEATALGIGAAAALGAGASAAPGASASAAPGASASAAQGAGESALSGTTSTLALHTFTLDSGASCSFFRDHTTLTPLRRPVAVSLADPSGGPILASFSTVLLIGGLTSSLLRVSE
ncbi:unnamed protein product [Closterium sp. NIES-65]|nr:unnamed protein product [Closterium sp. NIES-65]